MKVAFIGLGIMGSRMAQNLLGAGHELVVHNRTHSKAGGLLGKGAVFAASPSAAVKDADVLITMLAEPASVDAVARGKHGFLNSLSPDTVWMDCSTVDPAFAREISAECKQRGLRFLETPVSGTRVHAEEGVLKFSVGGDKADLEVVRPLMEIMGNQIDHSGPCGSASSMKLVLNHMMACSVAAFAESVVLGQALGIDRDTLFDLITGSVVAAPFLMTEKEKMKGGEFELDFPLNLMTKDMKLISQTADDVGVAMPVATCVKDAYQLAEEHGYGDDDYTAIYKFLNHTQRK